MRDGGKKRSCENIIQEGVNEWFRDVAYDCRLISRVYQFYNCEFKVVFVRLFYLGIDIQYFIKFKILLMVRYIMILEMLKYGKYF